MTAIRIGSRRVIAAADRNARKLGLRAGQTIAQAQASVPGLVIVEATPEADAAALQDLAGWCLRYSPLVQPDPPDGIFLDVTGAAHLFGGEALLLQDVSRRLARAGIEVRAAIADTPGAAAAIARFGADPIVPPGGAVVALAGLPVAALRIGADVSDGLHRLGIERIGQMATVPRASLTLRFGPEPIERYDKVFGHSAEPLVPFLPAEAPQVRLAFAEPLGHADGLAAALMRLTVALCRDLEARQSGLRQLDAVFRRVDGHALGLRIGTAAASRDPRHLERLLLAHLAEIDPGFGIDELVLVAARIERIEPVQTIGTHLDLDGENTVGLDQLVDKLGVRIGSDHIYRAAPVESLVPERSVRRLPPLAPATGGAWPTALTRPSRIIEPPEPITAVALLPDNPPTFFIWRRVRHIVKAADGPERVRGEWWRADEETASLRDYYRVEDQDGCRFWLFRDAPADEGGRWWLHGRFS